MEQDATDKETEGNPALRDEVLRRMLATPKNAPLRSNPKLTQTQKGAEPKPDAKLKGKPTSA